MKPIRSERVSETRVARLRALPWTCMGIAAIGALAPSVHAWQGSAGEVLSHAKISSTAGGLAGPLDNLDWFGKSAAPLGDLDGDGVPDLAVGAPKDDDGGGFDRGAVWVLFLNTDGSVKAEQKISDTQGGFTGTLDNADNFGISVTSLGDLDGDGVGDLAAGAYFDDDGGGSNRGAVWVLFLNADGTVRAHQKISDTQGGFTGVLDDGDSFGQALGGLGDLDGDGLLDLAVGVARDDDGGVSGFNSRGAVWVLFLNADGTVKGHQKISDTEGGFAGVLNDQDEFGSAVVSLGDLDGDGVQDLAVGAVNDLDFGVYPAGQTGAVWILFLNADGTVKSHQKINASQGGFTGDIGVGDEFGTSLSRLGDLDGDGVCDLAVGADSDDDGGILGSGAAWILFLERDGRVRSQQKISASEGGFTGVLSISEHFGSALAALGDLDGDGASELTVGANRDDDGGNERGAAWILSLDPGPWSGLGGELAGAEGTPVLAGDGTLVPGSAFSLTASNVPADTLGALVVGIATVDLPILGGVLVPSPNLLVGLLTDASGKSVTAATWPAPAQPGVQLFFQAWFVDPGAVQGFTASSAIAGTTP